MRRHGSRLTLALVLVASFMGLALGSSSALAVEANGTFLQDAANGGLYEVIGGAAIHIDSCTSMPSSCASPEPVSDLDGYASVPANGSVITIEDGSGYIGEIIGGALVHIDNCADIDCSDGEPLDSGGAADYMAAHPTPTDGSTIRSADGPDAGYIGEVIGGAVIHVDSCNDIDCSQTVNIDSAGLGDYISAHPFPTNGTYVQVASGPQAGLIARAAGGAFLTIGDCASLGGCPSPIVQIDAGGFASYESANPIPVDGTYLLGLPSNTTWEVLGGQRQTVPANSQAVPVDDASLNVIPVATPATSSPGSGSGTTSTTVTAAPPAASPTKTGTHPTSAKCSTAAKTKLHGKKTTVCVTPEVKVTFLFSFRWDLASSQIVYARAVKLERPDRVTLSCTGAGCPYRTDDWKTGTAQAYLKKLAGPIYHSGDRLTMTVSRTGEKSERISLTIRRSSKPKYTVTL